MSPQQIQNGKILDRTPLLSGIVSLRLGVLSRKALTQHWPKCKFIGENIDKANHFSV